MNKWIEILLGLVLLIAAISIWIINPIGFGTATLEFLKGGIVWLVILIGLLFLLIGISDLKD